MCIVGGGISGLTLSYLLLKSGLNIALLEKNRLCIGTTAGTTGKVTSEHGLLYAELDKQFNYNVARLYGEKNQDAIEKIEKIISEESIDCNWRRLNNYVYSCKANEVAKYIQEYKVTQKIGLPSSIEYNSELPFEVAVQLRFDNQANFNAVKYCLGLSKVINNLGGLIYENSEAKYIKDGLPCHAKTTYGSIKAKNIVLATKIPPRPLLSRMSYAAHEYPTTSYIVASRFDGNIGGMYISTDKGLPSLLQANHDGKQYLLVSGESHIPGFASQKKRIENLENFSKTKFHTADPEFAWKAMDYIPYDNLPLVGKLQPWSKNISIMTGFKKWGLTNSFVAATIIRDQILGEHNELSAIYNPNRFSSIRLIPKTLLNQLKNKIIN